VTGVQHASWAERLSLRAPRITSRGEIDPPVILGLGSGTLSAEGITAEEAREAAAALLALAAKCDRASEVITPHLQAAVEAAASL
jgi:hypothetical protein